MVWIHNEREFVQVDQFILFCDDEIDVCRKRAREHNGGVWHKHRNFYMMSRSGFVVQFPLESDLCTRKREGGDPHIKRVYQLARH